VHTLEAAQPTHSLREFSIGNGRLFADRFSHQVSAFAFDLPTAQRAKLRRDGEIGEMQSVAQRAMDDRSFDPQVSDLLRRLEAKAPTDPTDILRHLIDPDPDMLVLEAH
jgi:hypothetical protein